MFPVVLTDVGLATVFTGLVLVVRPVQAIGISNRVQAAAMIAAGALLALVALLLPASETAVGSRQTMLDRVTPSYQFHEVHSIAIRATPERVYRAIKSVTADDILFFRTLVWIRRFGRPGPENIMNAPEHRPLLDVATRTTFAMLADDEREIAVATLVHAPSGGIGRRPSSLTEFQALSARPGFAIAAMNFIIERTDDGSCVVSTETRVYGTDSSTRRRFAAYWRIIYPGSSLIRRMWLRAIREKAEHSAINGPV